jgi:hypothetical protein
VYCPYCGKEVVEDAVVCIGCGRSLVRPGVKAPQGNVSPKSRLVAALLAWFVGVLGVHRFYLGKTGTGLLMLFTLGGLWVWSFIDFVLIVGGDMKDKEGLPVTNWSVE